MMLEGFRCVEDVDRLEEWLDLQKRLLNIGYEIPLIEVERLWNKKFKWDKVTEETFDCFVKEYEYREW